MFSKSIFIGTANQHMLCLIMLIDISFQQWILMGNTEGIAGGWDKLTLF
jgi:hypothetical protein